MNKFTKIIFTSLVLFVFTIGYSTTTNAESQKQKDLRLISELKEKIENLGETPIKKKPFKHNLRKDYIAALEEQLEKLEKEKGIKDKKQALLDDLCKQIKELDPDAKTVCDSTEALDKDEDVIAAKKQIEDLKKLKEEENKKAEAEAAKKEEEEKKKAEAEAAKQEKEEEREMAIMKVKKEIYFLGGTPISEFEIETEDAYLDALRKQIEELKIQKKAEEKKIAESIPEWFLMPPQGSDVLMYVRGTAKSDNMQMALDTARDAAFMSLGQKVEIRLASKVKKTIMQAGMGEDQGSKTKINLISSTVVDEVTVSGIEVVETKLVSLDNGYYRAFLLIEYPVVKAYKTYLDTHRESMP